MRSPIFVLLALLSAVAVNAHFQLQFPAPRGVFNEDNEPTFCDGYTDPAANRTDFPLSGGFYVLHSEHPSWTAGVTITNKSDPTSFDDFSQVNNFFTMNGEGDFCIPLDFKTSNFTGLQDGQNVTIEIVFAGGDGQLYQCADLTLRDNFSISNVTCTNATSNTSSALAVAQYSSPASALLAFAVAAVSVAMFA